MKAFYEKSISMWKLQRAQDCLRAHVYSKVADLTVSCAVTPEPVPYEERLDLEYRKVSVGEQWGELWDCAWFHFEGQVPAEAEGKKLVLLLDVSGEGCLYDRDGSAVRGITNINSHYDYSLGEPGKRVVPFAEKSNGKECVDLWVDVGNNDLFGTFKSGKLTQAEIAEVNDCVRDVYYDYWVLFDLLKTLDKDSARYCAILYALNEVAETVCSFSGEEMEKCRAILKKELDKKNGDTSLTMYAIGHAHLDLAWLWPIRETKRKALRTFSTVIANMERYPHYIFGGSQPQQFQWVKEQDPKLYGKIKEKIAEGRLEPQGAMWVEPDLNVTSGESLCRQIMMGKNYWKEEFGQDVKIAHIPDVFGFNGALPQIMKKSGVDYLLTIKMSWNKYNQFPYHTFRWQGVDGTEVLVHMPPEGTYNSAMAPHSVMAAEKNFVEKGLAEEAVILYGIGDGGGGPGTEHLERLQREFDLNGIAKVKSGTEREFFAETEKNIARYPLYKGEMYLEKHQGTYTTQARNKYFNRRMEFLLKDAELFLTYDWLKNGGAYPKEEMDQIWQEVLLYQFHDILPGSSIKRVYDESVPRYEKMEERLNAMIAPVCDKMKDGVFNPTSVTRKGIVEYNGKNYYAEIPAYSAVVPEVIADTDGLCADADVLESKCVKVVFNADGQLISVFDKINKREVLKEVSNVLNVYEDNGDAWDMEEGYLHKCRGQFTPESVEVCVEGGYAVRRQVLRYGNSTLTQNIRVNNYDTMVDFSCTADWHETNKFLKAEFTPDIFTNTANCSSQFCNVKRSLSENNPYECAQDEICAHRYMDLSEPEYGVALLNDCKYGHHAKDGVIKLSLLRSSSYPGEQADQGEHRFRYALYPHANEFASSDVVEKAYQYNNKVYNCMADSILDFEGDGCVVECFKRSENGAGVVIRVCEEKGKPAAAVLRPGFEYSKAYAVTIDEKVLAPLESLEFSLKPFEIVTVLLEK